MTQWICFRKKEKDKEENEEGKRQRQTGEGEGNFLLSLIGRGEPANLKGNKCYGS